VNFFHIGSAIAPPKVPIVAPRISIKTDYADDMLTFARSHVVLALISRPVAQVTETVLAEEKYAVPIDRPEASTRLGHSVVAGVRSLVIVKFEVRVFERECT
jgi:hypothetical protein